MQKEVNILQNVALSRCYSHQCHAFANIAHSTVTHIKISSTIPSTHHCSQAEARGAGWTRLVEMGDALHRGQRLTGSLWGSPDSVFYIK